MPPGLMHNVRMARRASGRTTSVEERSYDAVYDRCPSTATIVSANTRAVSPNIVSPSGPLPLRHNATQLRSAYY